MEKQLITLREKKKQAENIFKTDDHIYIGYGTYQKILFT